MEDLYLIQGTTLQGIGDAVRTMTGKTELIPVPQLETEILGIKTGVETGDATATAKDILLGETVYVKGVKVTGTMPNNGAVSKTLDTSTTSYTITEGYHDGTGIVSLATETKSVTPSTSAQNVTPSSGKVLSKVTVGAISTQEKTVTSSTSAQTVTPDSGKYLSKVTVNAIGTATQATPSISVSSSGLITASATQNAGYVSAGTKSATKQLTTQAAKTITPTTSVQTAVSSGVYTTGDVTVAAISTQEKTVASSTSAQTVTPDSGKYLSKVTVNAIETATQATPSISVDSSGLITASTTQNAGYVSAGTKSSTKQLATQAAKTVTPSTSSQTAVASGVYTTGDVIVEAIPSNYVEDGYKAFSGSVTLDEDSNIVYFPRIPIKSLRSFIVIFEGYHPSDATSLAWFFSNHGFNWENIESYNRIDWTTEVVTITRSGNYYYGSNVGISSNDITDDGIEFNMDYDDNIVGSVFAAGTYNYTFIGR